MSATTTAAAATTSSPAEARTTPLWRTAAVAGIVAAVATTVVAAVALAADVPLEVDGEEIPVAAFAQLTLVGAVLGLLLAKALVRWTAKPQRNFVATTLVLTALSILPDLTIPATAATKLTLIATHLVAAAIIVPAVARRLPARTR